MHIIHWSESIWGKDKSFCSKHTITKAVEGLRSQNSLHWFLDTLWGEFPVIASLNKSNPEVTISSSCVYSCLFWRWNPRSKLYFYTFCKVYYLFITPHFPELCCFLVKIVQDSCMSCFWRSGHSLARGWLQANTFYLYTGQTGISSHSLSSYKVSGHACPPLAASWTTILYRDCLTAVALPVK